MEDSPDRPTSFVKRGPPQYPARLKQRRYSDHSIWIIRHSGQCEISTGCIVGIDDQKAQLRLSEFIIKQTVKELSVREWRNLQLDVLLTEYKNSIGSISIAPKSKRSWMRTRIRATDNLILFFGNRTIGQVKISDSADYVDWRTKQQIKQQTKAHSEEDKIYIGWNGALQDLSQFGRAMRYLAAHYQMPTPVLAPLQREDEPRIGLTRDEVARLLYACRGRRWDPVAEGWERELVRDPESGLMVPKGRIVTVAVDRDVRKALKRFLLIGLQTGTRHDAILGLRWKPSSRYGSIDVARGKIRRKGTGVPQTNKRRDPAMLPARMRWYATSWKEADEKAKISSVIHKGDGQPYLSMVTKVFANLVQDAGLDPSEVTPHVLRHTLIHWLLERGASAQTIAALVGCTVETLFRWYGKETCDGQEQAIACLDDRLGMREVGKKRRDPREADRDEG